MIGWIVGSSLRFRGLVVAIAAGLLAYGVVQLRDAPVDVLPEFTPPTVEIQTEALRMGMDGVLRARFRDLHGITNGIDTTEWDPLNDRHIPSPYGPLTLDKKYPNKLALKRRLGLAGSNEKPLLGMVSRLTQQKGVDLLVGATPALMAMGAQVVVVEWARAAAQVARAPMAAAAALGVAVATRQMTMAVIVGLARKPGLQAAARAPSLPWH